MDTVWRVLADVIVAFIVVMFIRLIFDYVQLFAREWRPRGPVLIALETCYSLTDPPLKFVHRSLPPLRVGAFSQTGLLPGSPSSAPPTFCYL